MKRIANVLFVLTLLAGIFNPADGFAEYAGVNGVAVNVNVARNYGGPVPVMAPPPSHGFQGASIYGGVRPVSVRAQVQINGHRRHRGCFRRCGGCAGGCGRCFSIGISFGCGGCHGGGGCHSGGCGHRCGRC